MFRQLAKLLEPGSSAQIAAETVLATHPIQLSRYVEEAWIARNTHLLAPNTLDIPTTIPQVGLERDSGILAAIPGSSLKEYGYPPAIWDHLIYAYMIENTRIYEIFRRVIEEYAFGEKLSIAGPGGQAWLRTTEALFYRDSPPFQIYALSSWVRPDVRAVRRNAYHRMFGIDLNHGTDDNRPYPYPRASAANTEFITTLEGLLREVWRAIENARNQIGPNTTDVSTIANLARALHDMLRVRRQDGIGNLARDELWHVSTMAWFHLTLTYNTPIVVDLKAEASSAAERLQKIGERVGLPAHGRSDSYFNLAESLSPLLRAIEVGTFNSPAGAPGLYQVAEFQEAIQRTITHWSIATGRDVKSPTVAIAPTPVAPARSPSPSPNGRPAEPATV